MKTKLTLLGSLMMLILTAIGAHAVVLFQDNFPYPNGPIGIQSGGNGGGGGGIWVSGSGATYGTSQDIISTGNNALEIMGTGASDLPRSYFTNGVPGLSMPGAPLFTNTVYFFPSNAPVAALYASFQLEVDPSAFTTNVLRNNYFAYFSDTNFDFGPRIYVCTNTAGAGNYRVAIANFSATPTTSAQIIQTDLIPGNSYTIVVRYVLSTGLATIWLNPANEPSTALTPSAVVSPPTLVGISVSDTAGVISTNNTSIVGFGVRNSAGTGPLFISSLAIGNSFADVMNSSDGSNPVFIVTQPQNTTNFAGQPATLSVIAGGDQDTMTYQWSQGGTNISGATASSYTVASLSATDQGNYTVFISNAATPSGVTSSSAFLAVLPIDITPTITTQPTNTSISAGSSVNFTVTATDGGAPLAYQWFLGANAIPGETTSTLNISSCVFSNAGTYKVTVTNPNGTSVTSSNAVLTITPPAPVACTIQYLRSLLDSTNYTTNSSYFANGGPILFQVTGTNTTWENFTTSGNSEFFIQDATAGIAIFWGGAAAATHMPPAGAVVTVVAPISIFSGLLELSPTFTNQFHSVTWSNVGPATYPLPFPFDPNLQTNANFMQKHLVGEYFGATNVFLDTASGPLFATSANEPFTNGAPGTTVVSIPAYNATNKTLGTNFTIKSTNVNGQVYNVIFYNSHSDVPGAAKPVGPVTIYGVMGIFSSGTPNTSGYEFTPTRLADIVPAVTVTNVISNVIRYGDLTTNSYTTTVLQPGETLTMTVYARDPGAGTATLSGLSGNGTWSAISGNGSAVASATYTYTATTNAQGTPDFPTLTAAFSSSGYVGVYSNINVIYVPTPGEQKIRISEVFASPTSNTNSPAYDPLLRPIPETGTIAVNDQYVEIVNLNTTNVNINRWTIYSGLSPVYQFVLGENPAGGSATIVYGGPSGTDSNAPTLFTSSMAYRENAGSGLSLNTGGGTVSLYNLAGFLIDRVAYPAAGSLTNSFSRFLYMNGPMVPQAYVNTNAVTPGAQYDGGSWASNTTLPTPLTPTVKYSPGNSVVLTFPVTNTNKVLTLWQGGGDVRNPFFVTFGQQFKTNVGSFTITNPPPTNQFYSVTTE